ncbi:MAG: tRNA 2-thiouridine(34) synthase MnmA [Candidatus Vogelbacteria bacterium RIFOXYD1_FULL_44_32]|uniref:tRNA-specific 2-thiouridylase MnmA n=1 Tax=Candidatus Vogelbacteria bacterium RIFOXYD1_FULL_44_32 TaxID=1802438 RepID=A0A1G2QDT7_9BACT|nr:MAG: tRNA 2-thiouridine(34) synthase MnmA [Candidatus Vogelbacteria bacterium RIFOXYD1_FULL_44_32]
MDRQKVFVGLSGGVDSSVSAALLVEQNYDVTGVFIKVWEPPQERFKKVCTWRDDRRDAMRVAAKLGIPFITIDLSAEYKQGVVDYMIAEYKAGRTPNPDVMCNKMVKFGAFYNWAIEQGADYVATGHYAQVKNGQLLKAVDDEKDQTYFIWNLTREQLKHIIFPIGGYKKPMVRKLAEKFGLATATKKDSQGLCFIGKLDVKDFLKEFIAPVPGEVVDEEGKVLGTHDGITFYTLGERHSFKVKQTSPEDKPWFVVDKDIENNCLVVSNIPKKSQFQTTQINLESVNWILDEPVKDKIYTCRVRYRQVLVKCYIKKENDKWWIFFLTPEPSVTPGQSLVVYDENICLGGGIIA